MRKINSAEIDGNGNIVIQNSDNSIITVNTTNPEEIRKFFIDFQNQLSELPKQVLDLMNAQDPNSVPTKGANIYLGLQILIQGANITGIGFNVTITNLTKENRFFNVPFFKLSAPFEGSKDSFSMIDKLYNIPFPKKLEYGEVVSEIYLIRPQSRVIFDQVILNDPNATIQTIISTTIGEVYYSNEYSIQDLLTNYRYAR